MRIRTDESETEVKVAGTLNPANVAAFELLHVILKRAEDEAGELASLLQAAKETVDFMTSLLEVTKDDRKTLGNILSKAEQSHELNSVIKLAHMKATTERERVTVTLEGLQSIAQSLSSLMHEIEAEQRLLTGLLERYDVTRSSRFDDREVVVEDNRIDILQSRVEFLEGELATPWPLFRKLALRDMARSAALLLNKVSLPASRYLMDWAEKQNPLHATSISSGQTYSQETALIVARYFPMEYIDPPVPLHMQVGSDKLARDYWVSERHARVYRARSARKLSATGFSIVTPFFAHLEFFRSCARSIEAAGRYESIVFEWIIVNDDPTIANDRLENCVPPALRTKCRVVGGESNEGISRSLNRGIRESQYDWIILLDCDDMLEPQALQSAAKSIREYPNCRYFTSLMLDIDEDGTVMRKRRNEVDIGELFSSGMIAGHMVMFERSLFEELGGFDPRFSGVQDYDFALRAQAIDEIVRIPEHLYCYRWHKGSQSVARMLQQARKANAARVAFLREGVKLRSKRIDLPLLCQDPEVFCVIRTQGNRMDLLSEAISSVRDQRHQVTPCIVVHADEKSFDFVQKYLRSELVPDVTSRAAVILHAPRTDLRRGYPCNVALDYLRAHRAEFDLLCFLDDDDHFLPNFAERLTDLLRLRGSAIAYGMSNALPKVGQPFVQHRLRPWLSILDSNFITFNSFLVRVDAVLDADIKFETDMHYLEDYHFLLQLAGAGARAEPLMEVIAEYRILGDGNAAIKRDIKHFEECQRKVNRLAESVARKVSIVEFWDDLLAFPYDEDHPDSAVIKRAYNMFEDGGRARV